MNTKGWIIVAAAVVLAVIGTRQLWPKEVTDREIVRLPSSTDTVTVRDTVIEQDTVFDRLIDTVQTTDTLVLADTIRVTDTVKVASLAPRWYVDTASFGQSLQDSTYISSTWIAADSSGIYRRDAFERQIATPGPVQSITADSQGVSVDYGEWSEVPDTCGFFCRGQLIVGGAAGGVLAYILFGP